MKSIIIIILCPCYIYLYIKWPWTKLELILFMLNIMSNFCPLILAWNMNLLHKENEKNIYFCIASDIIFMIFKHCCNLLKCCIINKEYNNQWP